MSVVPIRVMLLVMDRGSVRQCHDGVSVQQQGMFKELSNVSSVFSICIV